MNEFDSFQSHTYADTADDHNPGEIVGNGWLLSYLARNRPDLLARIRVLYQQVRRIPARQRRWLLKRAGATALGVALLLAIAR